MFDRGLAFNYDPKNQSKKPAKTVTANEENNLGQ